MRHKISADRTPSLRGRAGVGLLLALAFAACTDDQALSPNVGTGGAVEVRSYVSLTLSTPASPGTRANPTGGELGDGQEDGTAEENAVGRVVVFFYQAEAGVNAPATTPVSAAVVFLVGPAGTEGTAGSGHEVERTYVTAAQEVPLADGTYHLLAVANPRDSWWEQAERLTLGTVRDHLETRQWTGTGTDFLMSSEADATITLEANPASEPATATIDIERLAARIDYKTTGTYTCEDPQYEGGTVEILGAAIVNDLTSGSYLLKRVADKPGSTTPVYLGDETVDAVTGAATNYVLTPFTTAPGKATYGLPYTDRSDDPNVWAGWTQPGTSVGDGWYRIGYTQENTTPATATTEERNTGVVFRARFTPTGMPDYWATGETFFVLGNQLFATMEDMMRWFCGPDFDRYDVRLAACTGLDKVHAFARTLPEGEPSGYRDYLLELTDYAGAVKWSDYMLSECGYSMNEADGHAVTLDQGGVVTRRALQPHGVRTYEDAQCYYTWWVRHANDGNDTANGPMEYAIVRNNIYKLTVQSVYSLGGDVPGDESLSILVYVNDWLLLPQEEIPL